ncbi:MAG: serine/threonine-protein kinase, partial [Acidobacteriota bacterium]
MMTPEDWVQADAVVQQILDRPEGRAEILARACGDRPELRREVEALLDADARADGFLRRPLLDAPVPSAEQFAPGGRIGPYRLIEEIGFGSASRVYLAERDDAHYRRQVAVKVVDPGPESGELVIARFRAERQILARLDHPSIARLIDGGEVSDGRLYFVMELVEGRPIDRFAQSERLDLGARLRLMVQVCEAVAFAHEHLIVHRDLKPDHLLVTADGTLKLLDFGIAMVLEPATFPNTLEATATGLQPMTPSYAAPEQVRGQPITTATDVYALGLLLYELLVGRRAYTLAGRSPIEMERMICDHEPRRPSRAVSADDPRTGGRLAGDLDAIVAMALAKDPTRRYRTARQLGDDLRRHLDGEPVTARAITWGYQASKFVRRHRLAVFMAGSVLAVLALFAGMLWQQSTALAAERDAARLERDTAEAVTDFLVETFAEADPERTRGRAVTARQILDRGVGHVDRLDAQPAVQARLLTALGEVHQGVGAVPEAIDLLARAHRSAKATHGPRHPEVARIGHRLGAAYVERDDFVGAETPIREALSIRREHFGADHPKTAETQALLGLWLGYRGFHGRCLDVLTPALDVLRRVEPPTPFFFEMTFHLAGTMAMLGNGREALSILAEAAEAAHQAFGDDHPTTLEMRVSHARMLMHVRPDEALPTIEAIVERQEEILGPRHPALAQTLRSLAGFLVLRDPERAEAIGRRA